MGSESGDGTGSEWEGGVGSESGDGAQGHKSNGIDGGDVICETLHFILVGGDEEMIAAARGAEGDKEPRPNSGRKTGVGDGAAAGNGCSIGGAVATLIGGMSATREAGGGMNPGPDLEIDTRPGRVGRGVDWAEISEHAAGGNRFAVGEQDFLPTPSSTERGPGIVGDGGEVDLEAEECSGLEVPLDGRQCEVGADNDKDRPAGNDCAAIRDGGDVAVDRERERGD